MVIACLVQGFFPPEPVNVTWSPGKEGASVRNFPPVKATAGSLYTMSSQLTLPADQCPAGSSLQCHVQHVSDPSKPVSVPCEGQRRGGGATPSCDHVPLCPRGRRTRAGVGCRAGPHEGAGGGEGRRAEGRPDLLRSLSQVETCVPPIVSVPRATSPTCRFTRPPSRICL